MNKDIALEATSPLIDPLHLVSDIVNRDYRTAAVFRRHNINYCCAGKMPLKDVCGRAGISEVDLLHDLQEATRSLSLHPGIQFNEWKTDFLVNYIIHVHHAYLYKSLPELQTELLSFLDQHHKQYPEFTEIMATFNELSELLVSHNRYEEEVIFPYILRLDAAFSKGESYAHLFVKTLRKPLTLVQEQHAQIAVLIKKIQTLTDNYKVPEKACTKHRVLYGKLHELHDDIVQHKHLENNILIPRAAEIERVLLSN